MIENMQNISWFITGLSLLGVVLNIYKQKVCFVIWGATNFSWAWIDYQAGLHAQAFLFALYFLTTIWGFLKWKE